MELKVFVGAILCLTPFICCVSADGYGHGIGKNTYAASNPHTSVLILSFEFVLYLIMKRGKISTTSAVIKSTFQVLQLLPRVPASAMPGQLRLQCE